MTLLPIVERELRARARSRATYWTRFGVVLAGLVITLPGFLSAYSNSTPAEIGRGAFTGIIGMAFILCCAGCLLTADAIGSERREGTLGLLFLTRVRNIDVLLGKFASTGATCLLALVAFLPLLMIPVLAGGVTGSETYRSGLALLDTLLVALAAGLWVSARGYEKLRAARVSAVLVFGIVLGPLLANWITRSMMNWRGLDLASPLTTLMQASAANYKISVSRFWLSLSVSAVIGLGLLWAALLAMRQSSRIEVPVEGSAMKRLRIILWGDRPVFLPRKRKLSDERSPIHWLLSRQRGTKAAVWLGALVSSLFVLCLYVFLHFTSTTTVSMLSRSLSLAITTIQGTIFAWVASRFFVESRRNSELEVLLTTPLGARELVLAQWDYLKRLFRWPVLALLFPIFFSVINLVILNAMPNGSWGLYYLTSLACSAVETIVGLGALCWAALWFGFRASSQVRAILWTLILAKGVPYMLNLALSLLGSYLAIFRSGTAYSAGPGFAVWNIHLLSQALILLCYFQIIRRTRHQLLRELAGAEPASLDFRHIFAEMRLRFDRTRHWTPAIAETRKKAEDQNPKSEANPNG
jgi:ABC-type transport system involved in multi-copper enzyme maturation permease subunit